MAGCTTSELVDVWSDSSFHSPPLTKFLVVSVAKNPVKRRIWEDAFTGDLVRHNVAATASYRVFPDSPPDTNQVLESVRSHNYDGILITSQLPPETKSQYMRGYVTSEQEMRYDPRRDRFVTYYHDIEHAGYVDSETVNIRTIDVWATANEGRMIWSGTSRSSEPNSTPAVRPEIVRLVMSDLTRRGIIAADK